ncbi:NUDIX domain-containing protein [Glutamicibacter sp. NPDC087344]|uniref:NUDIX domain-containing protein n=1 Tax=Glutamicibacter sp. NPDC087344 TaxID=3363994 RepID=UPI0037F5793D
MDEFMKHHVSCALLVRAGKVLLVHRSPSRSKFPKVWDLPGGHVEDSENSRQAIVRELREELNVEISEPTTEDLLATRQDENLILEIWRISSWDGVITNAEPQEHDDYGWFALDEAMHLDLVNDAYQALLKQVLA